MQPLKPTKPLKANLGESQVRQCKGAMRKQKINNGSNVCVKKMLNATESATRLKLTEKVRSVPVE